MDCLVKPGNEAYGRFTPPRPVRRSSRAGASAPPSGSPRRAQLLSCASPSAAWRRREPRSADCRPRRSCADTDVAVVVDLLREVAPGRCRPNPGRWRSARDGRRSASTHHHEVPGRPGCSRPSSGRVFSSHHPVLARHPQDLVKSKPMHQRRARKTTKSPPAENIFVAVIVVPGTGQHLGTGPGARISAAAGRHLAGFRGETADQPVHAQGLGLHTLDLMFALVGVSPRRSPATASLTRRWPRPRDRCPCRGRAAGRRSPRRRRWCS